jgi:hypothetical protein
MNVILPERFASKFKVIKGGCWEWTSALGTNGYGVYWIGGGKSKYAHRLMWELANGRAIPAGHEVMHSCDNRRCVNPAHLSAGTRQDNAADCVRKGRQAKHERNGGAKLTACDVLAIREEYGRGATQRDLARRYGVGSKSTIGRVVRGTHWRDLHPRE